MNDLISRQAVLKLLSTMPLEEAMTKALLSQSVKQMDAAQPEPQWTPVTEGVPKVKGCYLVSVKNEHERRYSKTAWFEKGSWFARQDVIAWMPCPKPYNAERRE